MILVLVCVIVWGGCGVLSCYLIARVLKTDVTLFNLIICILVGVVSLLITLMYLLYEKGSELIVFKKQTARKKQWKRSQKIKSIGLSSKRKRRRRKKK